MLKSHLWEINLPIIWMIKLWLNNTVLFLGDWDISTVCMQIYSIMRKMQVIVQVKASLKKFLRHKNWSNWAEWDPEAGLRLELSLQRTSSQVLFPTEWSARNPESRWITHQTTHKLSASLALTGGGDTDTMFCCESHSWITELNIRMQKELSVCPREPEVKPQAVNHEKHGGQKASK